MTTTRFDPGGGGVLTAGRAPSGTRLLDGGGTRNVYAEDSEAAAVTPDGTMVVTSYGDGDTLRLDVFVVVSAEMIQRLPVGGVLEAGDESLLHAQPVNDVELDDRGTRFASAGADGRVVVWDSVTFEPIAVLEGHTGAVLDLAFNPVDANEVASGARMARSPQVRADLRTRLRRPARGRA